MNTNRLDMIAFRQQNRKSRDTLFAVLMMLVFVVHVAALVDARQAFGPPATPEAPLLLHFLEQDIDPERCVTPASEELASTGHAAPAC